MTLGIPATIFKRKKRSEKHGRHIVATQVRLGRLRDVFRSERNDLFDAQVARLCVLYEDLRIEMTGIAERSLPALDVLDPETDHPDHPERIGNFRQFYFMRRSIATTFEFASALRLLSENPTFAVLARTFDDYSRETWNNAIAFFDKERESVIRAIRNDIGGHFGQKAARSALQYLRPEFYGQNGDRDDQR